MLSLEAREKSPKRMKKFQAADFFELPKSRGPLHQNLCLQQVEEVEDYE